MMLSVKQCRTISVLEFVEFEHCVAEKRNRIEELEAHQRDIK